MSKRKFVYCLTSLQSMASDFVQIEKLHTAGLGNADEPFPFFRRKNFIAWRRWDLWWPMARWMRTSMSLTSRLSRSNSSQGGRVDLRHLHVG